MNMDSIKRHIRMKFMKLIWLLGSINIIFEFLDKFRTFFSVTVIVSLTTTISSFIFVYYFYLDPTLPDTYIDPRSYSCVSPYVDEDLLNEILKDTPGYRRYKKKYYETNSTNSTNSTMKGIPNVRIK